MIAQSVNHVSLDILAAPTRRMPSSRCFLKSGITGGYWPPLQGVCVHPGTCGNPGLQADSIRPYRAYTLIRVLAKNRGCGRILSTHTTAAAELPQQIAYANVPQAKNRPSACAEGQLIFSEVTITKPCKQRKRHCRAEQHQQLPSGRLRPEPEWSTRLRPQHGTGRQRSCACQRSTA